MSFSVPICIWTYRSHIYLVNLSLHSVFCVIIHCITNKYTSCQLISKIRFLEPPNLQWRELHVIFFKISCSNMLESKLKYIYIYIFTRNNSNAMSIWTVSNIGVDFSKTLVSLNVAYKWWWRLTKEEIVVYGFLSALFNYITLNILLFSNELLSQSTKDNWHS